ncbi:MAG: RidA family protein [Actinomycetota bacterium]
MTRQLISSGGPWEAAAGYSRAVRVDDRVEVAGTVATDPDGAIVAPGDAYEQTRYIFATIERALVEAGATLADVVRTRAFITDIDQADGFTRAHGELFGDIRPAATLVAVAGLLGDGTVIEIEASAIIGSGAAGG